MKACEARGADGLTCGNCGSTTLVQDYQRGSLACKNCGIVVKDHMMDRGPEWRAFDGEQRERRSRGGAPMTYTIHDKGLSTQIDWKNRDSKGESLPPRRRSDIYRLRKWQRRTRVSNSVEQNLALALTEMERMSSQLGLPRNVREEASVLYRSVIFASSIRGRSIEGVVSAALYAACRKNGIPRTLEEIAEVSRASRREIGMSYRFISRKLDLHLPPTSPLRYVSRFGSELNVSGETKTLADKIIKKAVDAGLTSGRNPTGIAAASLYIASVMRGERRTQKDVADVAQVTEVTVRNRYRELAEKLDLGVELPNQTRGHSKQHLFDKRSCIGKYK